MAGNLDQLSSAIGSLQADVKTLTHEVTCLRNEQKQLKEQYDKWKGGIAIVLFLGGIAGWFVNRVT